MTITSLYYLAFVAAALFCYYIIPRKWQWIELLFSSIVFYCLAAVPGTLVYLLISTAMAWIVTNGLDRYREKEGSGTPLFWKAAIGTTIFLDLGLWFLLKGTSYVKITDWVAALGMGYYTLQLIGYTIDCCWGTARAQANPLKLLLFTSFFPQMITGPISRYRDLEHLYEGRRFSYLNLAHGAQRILWGYFKKLVIAERAGVMVDAVWANPDEYGGLFTWMALMLYPIQMYTDFSGCMDIVLGTAEMFGIKLAENFRNPFLALTSQEFWQRWHITLGTWAKDYVLYPLLKTRLFIKMNTFFKRKGHKKAGKFFTTSLGMLALWLVIGFWHGAYKYIVGVSLWYWLVLLFEEYSSPLFGRLYAKMGCDTGSFGFQFLRRIKTYSVYAIGAVFFRADSVRDGIHFIGRLIGTFSRKNWNPWILFDGSIPAWAITGKNLNLIVFGVFVLAIAAVLRERYGYARIWLDKQPLMFRWPVYMIFLFIVILYGRYGRGFEAAEFIYGGF